MKNNRPFGLAVAYVDDIQAARQFYMDVIGLAVEREAPNFVQFGPFAIASDESMDGKRQVELYWLTEDATAEYEHMRTKARVCMELRALPFGKVFGIADPSGQPRYLLELAKGRPSRAV